MRHPRASRLALTRLSLGLEPRSDTFQPRKLELQRPDPMMTRLDFAYHLDPHALEVNRSHRLVLFVVRA